MLVNGYEEGEKMTTYQFLWGLIVAIILLVTSGFVCNLVCAKLKQCCDRIERDHSQEDFDDIENDPEDL